MKKKTLKGLRRYFSAFLSICIILMSFPSYADEIETISGTVDFSFEAESFLDSVSEITRNEDLMDSGHIFEMTDYDSDLLRDYQKLFNQPEIYEFYPEYAGSDNIDGAGIRTFIRTIDKNWKDGTYHLSGEEKLIFLFTNESGQDVIMNTNVGIKKLPQIELGAWMEPLVTPEKPLVSETTSAGETTEALPGTEETLPTETDQETMSSQETKPSSSSPEASGEDSAASESENESENQTANKPSADVSAKETTKEELTTEHSVKPAESKETELDRTEAETAHEPSHADKAESAAPKEETDAEKSDDNTQAVSLSTHYVPMVGNSDERIGVKLEDESLDSTDSDEEFFFTGRKLPVLMSEDGYSAIAFVTDFSQVSTEDSNTASPYRLHIQHILATDDVEYYEDQVIVLSEEDFDQDGRYLFDNQTYEIPGITAVTSEDGLTADKTSFQPNDEDTFSLQTEIHYIVEEGYKVQEEEHSEDVSAAMDKSKSRIAVPEEPRRIDGFPYVFPMDAIEITVASGMRQHFYAGVSAESLEGYGKDKTIDVTDVKTVYIFGGESGNQTSLVIDSSVKDLNLILGADMNSTAKDLVIDAGKTKQAAITVKPGASVTLTLLGDTDLRGDEDHAGIELLNSEEETASVVINGEGSLTVSGGNGGAGIGGGTNAANGNLTITGGTITASGGNGGAGIGGGNGSGSGASYKTNDRSGGTIEINGGEIHANGGVSAAGIGGGNHGDGGDTTISGNAVVYANGGSGAAGIGSGLGSHETENGKKGPGYYHGGNVTITENCRVTALGGGGGAGIGGGMYGDSGEIIISGGTVDASGLASTDKKQYLYQGGAGIGGGYEGHANVTITGGSVTASAIDSQYATNASAGIGSGATPNSNGVRDKKGRGAEALYKETTVNIDGGVIEASGGATGGAGIGGGFGADSCTVNISGGTIVSEGGLSSRTALTGGAGIGSGCNSRGIKDAYSSETQLDINIQGGEITATGGWGASAVGSGADNIRAAAVSIDSSSQITAYADGTKFAIDTYDRNNADEPFVSREADTLLQGTFMKIDQDINYEGFQAYLYQDLDTGSGEEVIAPSEEPFERIQLPDGYRSFAISTEPESDYLVKAEKAGFDAKWFVFEQTDARETAPIENNSQTYHYRSQSSSISDNYWLFLYKNGDVEETVPPVPELPTETQPPVTPEQPTETPPTVTPELPTETQPTVTPELPTESQPTVTPEQPTNSGTSDGDTGSGGDSTTTRTIKTQAPAETVTIEPENVPLAALPPVTPDGNLITIDDGQIPLAALPKTGERSTAKDLTGIISGLFIGLYLLLSKKREKAN